MSTKTRLVDTSTLRGLKQAERLQAYGWKAVGINPVTDVITMTKEKPAKPAKPVCECSDTACPVHKGTSCTHKSSVTLYRVDMVDSTGTRFCEACADDAMESGLFDTGKNFYS